MSSISGLTYGSELIYGRVLSIDKNEKLIKLYDFYNEKERALTFTDTNNLSDIKRGDRIKLWISDEMIQGKSKIIRIYKKSGSDLTGIKRRLRKINRYGHGHGRRGKR